MSDRPVIVSLDWDWVTGDTSAGYSCCGMCKMPLFNSRSRGVKSKLVTDWRERFEELKALPVPNKTPVIVAECHGNIGEVFSQYFAPIVVDYDSHCDKYNQRSVIDCANWIVHLNHYGGNWYSGFTWNWKRMDAIFLCRSAPWTPYEMDSYFYELVWHLCFHAQVKPKFIGHMRKSMRRSYIKKFGDERVIAQ